MRIIVMCGKGGTGKTSLAAALGQQAAKRGSRTLVFSVDPAHSLADALQIPLRPQPTQVAANFWAAELEAVSEIDANWGELKQYASSLLASQGPDARLGGELSSLPGIVEFAALANLKHFADSGQFDTIVLDNAPTGFALRLLSLPEIGAWYAKHAMRLYERHGAQLLMMAPMVGATVPLPSTGVINQGLAIAERLRELPLLLADPAVTSTRLVLTPDQLAFAEAKKAYTHLCLYGLMPDEAIANQVLPAEAAEGFFAPRRAAQQSLLAEARAAFAPLPLREVPMLAEEPIGLEAIAALGERIWPSGDPVARQSTEEAITIGRDGANLLVGIRLPFVGPKEVDLAKMENELYITLGNHRRTLLLPDEARAMQPTKAKFSEGRLLVTLSSS